MSWVFQQHSELVQHEGIGHREFMKTEGKVLLLQTLAWLIWQLLRSIRRAVADLRFFLRPLLLFLCRLQPYPSQNDFLSFSLKAASPFKKVSAGYFLGFFFTQIAQMRRKSATLQDDSTRSRSSRSYLLTKFRWDIIPWRLLALGTWPSNLAFIFAYLTQIPNFRKIGQKLWSLL